MRFSSALIIGFIAMVMATPIAEPAPEAGLTIAESAKIMTSDKPVDLVSRQGKLFCCALKKNHLTRSSQSKGQEGQGQSC